MGPQQCVKWNASMSNEKHVMFGVPQGAALRSVLFIIHINDNSNIAQNIFSYF